MRRVWIGVWALLGTVVACGGDGSSPNAPPPEGVPAQDGGAPESAVEAGRPDPTPVQLRQAQEVRDYAAALKDGTACAVPLDWSALAETSAQSVLHGDGSDRAVFRALMQVQLGVPQGHQTLVFAGCGKAGATPWAQSTWYGVCGRPRGDGVVVTYTNPASRLGLNKGDLVLATDRHAAGPDFLEAVASEPVCGSSVPSASARRERAAASLFGVLEPGMTLTVRAPSGAERTVHVPSRDAASEWCSAPFGGFEDFEAKVTTRPDGIAVVRVPGFLSSLHPLPQPLTSSAYQKWIADYVERLRVAIEPVKNAPGIVWDARSNTGGSAEVALAIVAGFPGAKSGVVSKGFKRVPGSSPFAYGTAPISTYSYSLTAGGPLAHAGKVAVLVDGLTYSAGDFFAHASRHNSSAIVVGRPSAGAFGYGGNAATKVSGPPDFSFTVDGMKSVDANGKPLDGTSIVPDLAVEYDPADLVEGVDTVLEAAAKALLQ